MAAVPYIYWEKQHLHHCAVHACNNLVQNALFTENNFKKIARELDMKERALLQITTAKSQNASRTGDFSVQVIMEALAKLDLDTVYFTLNSSTGSDANMRDGFICNRKDHWLALRRIGGIWYNLNSLSKVGPTSLTSTTLVAICKTLLRDGYTILDVRGKYPKSMIEQDKSTQMAGRGCWFQASTIKPFVSSLGRKTSSPAQAVTDFQKGLKVVNLAIKSDNSGDPIRALELYTQALEYLTHALKTGQVPHSQRPVLMQRCAGYMQRAETLKKFLKTPVHNFDK